MIALDDDARTAARALLAWYRANRRALPWRESGDPYRVLVSEIMLQQTRVETVLSYYERFISAFPDVETLAAAPIEEVLAKWSGLGYYSRARRLHAAARAIVERGDFPRTEAELLELPGVGAYTAAAIASIAFGEPVAVVDGNVERVIARLLALDVDPAQGRARRLVRETASRLLVRDAAGDSNQALMELGAVICLPRRPRCLVCPLLDGCAARASGRTEELPVRAPRRPGVVQRRVVAVARRGRSFPAGAKLRSQRAAGRGVGVSVDRARARARGVGGGRSPVRTAASGPSAACAAARGTRSRSARSSSRSATPRSASTREAVADGETLPEPGWFSLEQIEAVPTTSMVRKVLACLDAVRAAGDASERSDPHTPSSDIAHVLGQQTLRRRLARLAPGPLRALDVAGVAPQRGGVEEPLGERRLARPDVDGELGYERRLHFLEQPGRERSIAARERRERAMERDRLGQIGARRDRRAQPLVGLDGVAGCRRRPDRARRSPRRRSDRRAAPPRARTARAPTRSGAWPRSPRPGGRLARAAARSRRLRAPR